MTDSSVSNHYTQDGLLSAIRHGIAALGRTTETVTDDDLALLDEFHIGGRQATENLLDRLGITSGQLVLDIGCGIGGAARVAARRYGARVTGIDATAQYVETGQALCDWLGLGDCVTLQHGSALDLPFADTAFDAAYMLHVGMNIADKAALCVEIHRVLKPGSAFGIYDIMRTGDGEISYPVPWATVAEMSAIARPEDYRDALQTAGFTIVAECNRRDSALEFFKQARAQAAKTGAPSTLGIQLLMGETASQKIGNMVKAIQAGSIAPVELIARKS